MPGTMANLWLIPYGCDGRQILSERQFEPVGLAYEVRLIRDRLSLGVPVGPCLNAEKLSLTPSDSQSDLAPLENQVDPETPAYLEWLKNLNPAEFKSQDHYKVLGLSKLRWAATDDEIRTAFRFKVLRHHPDKRGEKVSTDDDYFACIVRANDILGNPVKRRSFDSCDPKFNEEIPTKSDVEELESDAEFYETFGPVFERNSRWSKIHPVPQLGSDTTDFTLVELFYTFWYNFDSWREFSYLDEEDKDKGENRDERRWIDKQNKTARDKRRKDEVRRIRSLVELAHSCDPRVKRFKEAEKNRKETEKQVKADLLKQKKLAEELEKKKIADAERVAKELEEEKVRQQAQMERKDKELRKKALQKERKALQTVFKEKNFFADTEEEKVSIMANLDRLSQHLTMEKLAELNLGLSAATENQLEIFQQFVDELDTSLRQKSQAELKCRRDENAAVAADESSTAIWTEEEARLLVKAVTIFPVGTKSRWDVIATFINEHHHNEGKLRKSQKDVVSRVKFLQKVESTAKPERVGLAGLESRKCPVDTIDSAPSERITDESETPWSPEEQKRLEAALRSHPATDPARWDKVTACLPGRTKAEVKRRYKELAELVKAKKSAISQVTSAAKISQPEVGKK